MRRSLLAIILLIIVAIFLSGCTHENASKLTLEGFRFLKRGMPYAKIVEGLGEPKEHTEGSAAFVTLVYELETGEEIYLGFYPQADYLDSAYYFSLNDAGKKTGIEWIVPGSVDFPSGIARELTLSDFDGIAAGMAYFPDVYGQVGPPNATGYFEGNRFALAYNLSDGGRISMAAHNGIGCISTISYSPPGSAGGSIRTLSEDTQGICEGR